MCYTSYVEIFGHTGIRADWKLPITGFILQPFGLELMGEDHDLVRYYLPYLLTFIDHVADDFFFS